MSMKSSYNKKTSFAVRNSDKNFLIEKLKKRIITIGNNNKNCRFNSNIEGTVL